MRQDLANIRQAWQWAVSFDMVAEIKAAVYSLLTFLEIESLIPESQQMLEQAIQALRQSTRANDILPRLLVGQTRLFSHMNLFAEAEQHIEEAMPLALRNGDALDIANAYLAWASTALMLGNYHQSAGYAREAFSMAKSESLRRLEGISLNLEAHAQVRLGAREEVVEPLYQQALATFEELDDRRQMGRVLNQLGGLALNWGKFNQARRYWEQALELFVTIGDKVSVSNLANNVGDIYIRLGCFEKAKTYYEQSWQLALDTGTTGGSSALSGLGCAELMLGNLAAAEKYGRRALQAMRETNSPVHEAYGLAEFGPVLLVQARWAEAADVYHRIIQLATTLSEPYLIVDGMAGLAQIAFCQGQLGEALYRVEHILAHNDWPTLGGAYDPYAAYLICYRILKAHNDPRAEEILAVAYGRLQALLADLEKEDLRHCFLAHPVYNVLLTAYQNKV